MSSRVSCRAGTERVLGELAVCHIICQCDTCEMLHDELLLTIEYLNGKVGMIEILILDLLFFVVERDFFHGPFLAFQLDLNRFLQFHNLSIDS